MSARARPPAPVWFVVLLALACGWLLRATLPADTPDLPAPQLAFFGWFGVIAAAVYGAIKAVGELSLFFLYQAIQAVWHSIGTVYNAALEIGKGIIHGFQISWRFLKDLYEEVLKPGWTKLWNWIDRARTWLVNFFKPIYDFLRRIREEILKFYDHWVRPILDTIETARKALSVFKALGFEWAKKLDAELARVEEKINEPFLFALRKINEVIGIVDRIVTADGLFQRLALIRSIERDVKYVHAQLFNGRSTPLSSQEVRASDDRNEPPTRLELAANFGRHMTQRDGPLSDYDALVDVRGTIFAPEQ